MVPSTFSIVEDVQERQWWIDKPYNSRNGKVGQWRTAVDCQPSPLELILVCTRMGSSAVGVELETGGSEEKEGG